jgi:regulator of RNase E activity RraA
MMPYPLGGDAEKMTACQGLSEGEISVWSGDGEGVCYFGELIALGMRERGCVGSLVDGGVRDVRWLRQHNFPVFARYRTPVQSIGRWKVTGWQTPVKLRGATTKYVTVAPGDFILGDEDGVIVIPAAVLDQVLTRSEELTRKEIAIRTEIAKGLSLADALKTFGHV